MKDPSDRTKVVIRHLPPAISQSLLMEKIDSSFAGRYKWACFRPGKNSQKKMRCSQAYIDFKRPEDVVEFAEFFDGHIFVNEKGVQFKALVEYAPSQRVPKPCSKKDGREGTILKDPEYLDFLELISKPAENLPSAEIQLERREAERSGARTLIVTPLMEFVRRKRAAKIGSERSSGNRKLSRKTGLVPSNSSSSSKRGSEKRRKPTSIYVVRDNTKNGGVKEKSTYILARRREEQRVTDESVPVYPSSATNIIQDKTDVTGAAGAVLQTTTRKLLRPNEKESEGSIGFRQNQWHETGGKTIRAILSNKNRRQSPLTTTGLSSQSEQPIRIMILEKDKSLPQHTTSFASLSNCVAPILEKNDKHLRNKDRPDRSFSEVKSSKGGGPPTGYDSHERRVWVQKLGSAS